MRHLPQIAKIFQQQEYFVKFKHEILDSAYKRRSFKGTNIYYFLRDHTQTQISVKILRSQKEITLTPEQVGQKQQITQVAMVGDVILVCQKNKQYKVYNRYTFGQLLFWKCIGLKNRLIESKKLKNGKYIGRYNSNLQLLRYNSKSLTIKALAKLPKDYRKQYNSIVILSHNQILAVGEICVVFTINKKRFFPGWRIEQNNSLDYSWTHYNASKVKSKNGCVVILPPSKRHSVILANFKTRSFKQYYCKVEQSTHFYSKGLVGFLQSSQAIDEGYIQVMSQLKHDIRIVNINMNNNETFEQTGRNKTTNSFYITNHHKDIIQRDCIVSELPRTLEKHQLFYKYPEYSQYDIAKGK